MGFDKCMVSCIYNCGISQNSFIILKKKKSTLLLFIPLLLFYQSRQSLIFLLFSIVWSFAECHIVGITQYESFQIGFFHLAICIKVHPWFRVCVCVCVCDLIVYYSLKSQNNIHCEDVLQFIYPVYILLRDIVLLFIFRGYD